MKKVLYIHQKRNDAIGIVDNEQIFRLKNHPDNPFDFLEIYPKWTKIYAVIYNYIRNFFLIIYKSFLYKQIYFSYENPYITGLKSIFPWKKIFMCIHHIENWGDNFIGKIILAIPEKIFAISHFTKQQILDRNISTEKIIVNYNGISEKFYPEKIKNFYPKKYILYVGTELPRKNLENLIYAFEIFHKKHPEILFVKIGQAGWEEHEQNFDNFLKNFSNLQNNIILKREKMWYDELRKWYSNAEFYISVSKLEWFGLTIPEAIACECKIIASNIPPFREICTDKNLLVNPHNIEEIAKKMETTIKWEQQKIQLSRFNWNKNIKNLVNFFQKIS